MPREDRAAASYRWPCLRWDGSKHLQTSNGRATAWPDCPGGSGGLSKPSARHEAPIISWMNAPAGLADGSTRGWVAESVAAQIRGQAGLRITVSKDRRRPEAIRGPTGTAGFGTRERIGAVYSYRLFDASGTEAGRSLEVAT